jgi:DNA (cytosine-5)-methyltransferase 1
VPKSRELTYIDLFAGSGGLSVGLEKAGWALRFAVEKSPMAAETFGHNLVEPIHDTRDWERYTSNNSIIGMMRKKLVVADVGSLLRSSTALAELKRKQVDLVVGGPPCQGFSLAGRRNSSDERNTLPFDFIDIVKAVRPKFVVMENVLGMHSKFSKSETTTYEDLYSLMQSPEDGLDYVVQRVMANAMHFGAAQNRPRLLLVAMRKDLADTKGVTASSSIWRSQFFDELTEGIPDLAPIPIPKKNAATVRDALSDFVLGVESTYTRFLKSHKEWPMLRSRPASNLEKRNHNSSTVRKFLTYQLLKKLKLSPALIKEPITNADFAKRKIDLKSLTALKYPISFAGDAEFVKDMRSFKRMLNEFKTRKHSQRVLDLDLPSPTVVTAPDDFIHPTEPRVLTVREFARIQGFPDAYEFRSKVTTGGLKRRHEVPQYSQVGNAVSPFVATAIGLRLKEIAES